jgi:hypothetical protein
VGAVEADITTPIALASSPSSTTTTTTTTTSAFSFKQGEKGLEEVGEEEEEGGRGRVTPAIRLASEFFRLAPHRHAWKGRLKAVARCDDERARATHLPPSVQGAHGKGVLLNRWVRLCVCVDVWIYIIYVNIYVYVCVCY